MDTLITARWVLPITSPPIEDGAVRVRDGRITACGPRASLDPVGGDGRDAATGPPRRIDLGDVALLPGLVNTHAHLELTVLRGYLEDLDFFRWIRRLTEVKYDVLDPEEILLSALWGALEAARAGVTTLGEVCDLGVSREAIRTAGLRAILYQETFGPADQDADRSYGLLLEKIADHQENLGDRIRIGLSPHAPYTVSPRLFEKVARLSMDYSVPLSVHAAESRAERELVERGEGPFAEFLRFRNIAWKVPGTSTIEYLERLGVLRARPLLAHCVDCSAEDLERIAASGSAIAHCPRSNAKLGHGFAPLEGIVGAGIRVGLGSDSVASGNTCDLLEEARVASLLLRGRAGARALEWTAKDALRLATFGGAEALGLAADIGSLEPGKLADLCAVDLTAPHMEPIHDVESALVWSASARDVVFTMVGGEVILEEDRVPRLDEAELRAEVRRIREKLASRRRE